MQCDVTRIICISNKAKYFDKKRSYKNSTKEFILRFLVIVAIQPRKYWAKFCFIGTFRIYLKKMSVAIWQLIHVSLNLDVGAFNNNMNFSKPLTRIHEK